MNKHIDLMTVDEADKWCEDNSGAIVHDVDNNSVLLLIKEVRSTSKSTDRRYKLRVFNLTYLTIGLATEEAIWNMLNGLAMSGRRNLEVFSSIDGISLSDTINYGQKAEDSDDDS